MILDACWKNLWTYDHYVLIFDLNIDIYPHCGGNGNCFASLVNILAYVKLCLNADLEWA